MLGRADRKRTTRAILVPGDVVLAHTVHVRLELVVVVVLLRVDDARHVAVLELTRRGGWSVVMAAKTRHGGGAMRAREVGAADGEAERERA